jgi:hypothetical protein
VKNFALLALLVASPLFAEVPTLKLPAEVKGEPGTFIAIRAESSAAWVNFKADAGLAVFPSGLLSDRKATVLTAAKAGRYKLFAYTGNDDGGADTEVLIIVGNAPPVVVVPPEPDPGPVVPPVVVPPVITGKRHLLLVHETAEDTPEVARMIVGLRSGAAADYLKSKEHKLYILDDDSQAAAAWRPHFEGMKLPAIFILDETAKTLIHKQELPASTTAAQVVDIVKGKGG